MGAKTSEISVRLDRKEYAFVRGMADLVGAPLKTIIRNAVMREANRIWSRAQELEKQQREAQEAQTGVSAVPTLEKPTTNEVRSAEENASAVIPGETRSEGTGGNLLADAPPKNG